MVTFETWRGEHALDLSGECGELFIVSIHRSLTGERFNFADKAGRVPFVASLTIDSECAAVNYMNSVIRSSDTQAMHLRVNVLTYCLHPEQRATPLGHTAVLRTDVSSLKLELKIRMR
jgi:hypothetical protein